MKITKYPSFLIRYQEIVTKSMQNAFKDHKLPIYDHLEYFLGWKDIDGEPVKGYQGKTLRPSLCLLASEAVEPVVPENAVIAWLYNASGPAV